MASGYRLTKVEQEMRKHDFNVLNTEKKKVKKIAGVKMPMNVNEDINNTLMWYFISWHNKIGKWDSKKKMAYAKEISEISSIMPIHLMGREYDAENVQKVLSGINIKLFKYENNRFVVLNEDGTTLIEITAMNLYAMLIFLIDSISAGLEDQIGFDFIKLAKIIIKKGD